MERGLGDDVFEGECDLWEEISVGKISNKERDFEWGHEWREARNNMTQSERADLSSYRLIFGGGRKAPRSKNRYQRNERQGEMLEFKCSIYAERGKM